MLSFYYYLLSQYTLQQWILAYVFLKRKALLERGQNRERWTLLQIINFYGIQDLEMLQFEN